MKTTTLISSCAALTLMLAGGSLRASEPWRDAIARMPLPEPVAELTKTNWVDVMLRALQPNDTVKALVFMPGATDEFHFFNRGHARLETPSPTLLDAVTALTNQTLVRVTFRPPLLLLHTAEDPTEPLIRIEDERTAERIRKRRFVRRGVYNDRDWDFMHPILSWSLNTRLLPGTYSPQTSHFYRHSLAAHNLSGWEALEAVLLAGKTTATIQKRRIVFEGDKRVRAKPKLD